MFQIAICAVCFFDLIIAMLTPSTETMIFLTDGSASRYVADFAALFIGSFVLYKYGWRKVPSGWLISLLLFMIVSHFHAVNIHFAGAFIPNDMAIYDYKPMFECLLFFMMFMGIISSNIKNNNLIVIKNTLAIVAMIYGGFAVLQRFGLDQFYKIMDPININHMSRNPEVGGFISQPVFCAALLTMLLPFVAITKSWWKIGIVIAGIIATGNRTSLIAGAIAILYLFDLKLISKLLLSAFMGYLLLGTTLCYFNISIHHLTEARFYVWDDVIRDFIHSKCPGINNSHILTGIGIGSFPVIFPFYYSGWFQAHNEYLECLKGLGIIGLFLLVKFALKIPKRDKEFTAALLASLVLALTNATWHIPQLAFLTVLFIGLLYKTEELYARSECSTARECSFAPTASVEF